MHTDANHKTPEVRAWLEKHPRFKLHVTPTSLPWLTIAEGFFAKIITRRVGKGSDSRGGDLDAAICNQLGEHATKPKPFDRAKMAEDILTANDARCRNAMKSEEKDSNHQIRNIGRPPKQKGQP